MQLFKNIQTKEVILATNCSNSESVQISTTTGIQTGINNLVQSASIFFNSGTCLSLYHSTFLKEIKQSLSVIILTWKIKTNLY